MTPHEYGREEYSILIVATQPAAGILLQQCARFGWSGITAGLCSEAVAALQIGDPSIVLTQEVLPDGTWREVFRPAIAIRPGAVRVVSSGHSTLHLWIDVLAQGGYDLIPEPCPDDLIECMLRLIGQRKALACDVA